MKATQAPGRWRHAALIIWLMALSTCVLTVVRSRYSADLSAFLPSHPTPEQRVLIDQLRDGPASRLILVGIEVPEVPDQGPHAPADAAEREHRLARLSKALALALRSRHTATPGQAASGTAPLFASINNGEPVTALRDQALLLRYRYLLSPRMNSARLQPAGLHEALLDTLDLLGSSAGLMLGPLLTRDPTAEVIHLVDELAGTGERHTIDGVWASGDGRRALLLAQTQADGSDLNAQQLAVDTIRLSFAQTRAELHEADARLLLSGPGVFAAQSRLTIQSEASRLSAIGSAIIITLLLSIYRSWRALLLGLLPMLTGALVGMASVSLAFGVVHGITLGFGITLIGEAVDYAIYLFVQGSKPPERDQVPAHGAGFWATITLGVLTSVIGFSSLLGSSFQGLAQLGLFSMAGIVAAALVTRWVLPGLIPAGFAVRPLPGLQMGLTRALHQAHRLTGVVAVVVLGAAVTLWLHRDHIWSHDLASLSPVSPAEQDLDMQMRADLGAPDVRYLVVARAPSSETALVRAEQLTQALAPLVDAGVLSGVETPSRYLPSQASQRLRQANLPEPAALRAAFAEAAKGLPFVLDKFEPFITDVAQARSLAPLTRADLSGSSLALGVDSMLVRQDGGWTALLALRVPASSQAADAAPIRQAINRALSGALTSSVAQDVHFIDLKGESEKLYADYLSEALALSLWGALAVVALLAVVLRSPAKLLQVCLPLLCAVLVVAAVLVLSGPPLTLFHLVGLLLIVAVGSNYALFFVQRLRHEHDDAADGGVLASMLFANLSTVAGFGMLAWSQVPVLHAFGATVAPGAMLALIFSAVLRKPAGTPGHRDGHLA